MVSYTKILEAATPGEPDKPAKTTTVLDEEVALSDETALEQIVAERYLGTEGSVFNYCTSVRPTR